MPNRRIAAVVLVVSLFTTVGLFMGTLNLLSLEPLQVPPPASPPGVSSGTTTTGDLVILAEGTFWMDYMPSVPPEGAPFYSRIHLNITNTGDSTFTHLNAVRMTLYYNDTIDPLVTLNLTPTIMTFAPIELGPGDSIIMEFTNNRDEMYYPSIEEGTGLYARILFNYGDGGEAILTTSPSALLYTF